jgi:hypothetical protein
MESPAPHLAAVGRECLRLCGKALLAGTVGLALVITLTACLPDGLDQKNALETHAGTTADQRGHRVRQIQCTPDGLQAWVLRSPAEWQLIEVATGAVRFQHSIPDQVSCEVQRIPGPVTTVVYSNERGRFLCPLEEGGTPKAFLPATDEIEGMAASPEAPLIAIYGREILELWSISEGSVQCSLPLDHPISQAKWSSDGRWLFLIRTNGRFEVRDGETLTLRQSQMTPHFDWILTAWASGGDHVMAYNTRGIAMVWDLTADRIVELQTGVVFLQSVAIAPQGDFIVYPDSHNDVWLHSTIDTTAGRRYFGTASASVTALCVLGNGDSVLVGTSNGAVECWSTVTGLPLWNGIPAPVDSQKTTPSLATDKPVAQGAASCASTRS